MLLDAMLASCIILQLPQERPEILHIMNLSRSLFVLRFENKQPCVIRGIVEHWPATKAWANWRNGSSHKDVWFDQYVAWDLNGSAGLQRGAPSRTQNMASSGAHEPTMLVSVNPDEASCVKQGKGMRLSEIFSAQGWKDMHSIQGHGNSSAAVLINGRVLDNNPLLARDCAFTDSSAPLLNIFGVNLLQRLHAQIQSRWQNHTHGHSEGNSCVQGTRMPPIWRYFIASKTAGGGKMHQDPHGEHFWNAQVVGRKLWTIVRPEEVERLKRLPGGIGQAVLRWFDGSQSTARKWHAAEHNNTGLLRTHGRRGQWWQVVVEAGDLLYSPGEATALNGAIAQDMCTTPPPVFLS
jgi:hypothetical protein